MLLELIAYSSALTGFCAGAAVGWLIRSASNLGQGGKSV